MSLIEMLILKSLLSHEITENFRWDSSKFESVNRSYWLEKNEGVYVEDSTKKVKIKIK